MRLSRIAIIIFLLMSLAGTMLVTGSGTAFGQTEDTVHLTLEQSIDVGLKNSALVQKNENNVALNGEQLLQSYAQFLPNLGIRASYTYADGTNLYTFSGSNLVDQRSFSPNYALTTSLNIFNGLSDYAGLKLALAKRDASRFSLNFARQQVILDIVQTYLQVVLDRELLDIAVRNLAASNERLKLLKGQTEVGSASLADLYRQQAQTSSDELLLSNTQTRLNDDTTILIRKLRVDPLKKYEFEIPKLTPDVTPLAGKPVEELIKMAVDQRSDLKAQTLTVKSTDWDITRARSGYLPRLDLNFTAGGAGAYLTRQIVNGTDTLPPNQRSLWTQLGDQFAYSVSLNFTWSIFDRFLTRYNVASART
ncbi:MAG: TolC family protein, partial [Bdellovibrionia bacterium]